MASSPRSSASSAPPPLGSGRALRRLQCLARAVGAASEPAAAAPLGTAGAAAVAAAAPPSPPPLLGVRPCAAAADSAAPSSSSSSSSSSPAARSTLPGRATPEGTRRFVAARPLGRAHARALGKTGLTVAPIGFGCHRLEDTPEQRGALRGAIRCGCNLIDVAPGYTDGAAEAAVGRVLAELAAAGELRREEVVVVTKVGNIVGSSLRAPVLEKLGSGIARVREDVWHCLEPEWIEEELSRSLARLGLECVDCLLLHCPEFASRADGVDMEEVYRRIAGAFRHLETEVARGRIARYGVSAAFYPLRPSEPEHLLLDRVLAALPANGAHHFEVVQCPLNFAETQALWEPHGGPVAAPLVERCEQHGLAVLTNRPLDGLYGELRGVLRFSSSALPLNSELREEDAEALEAKLTSLCGPSSPSASRDGVAADEAAAEAEAVVTGELAGKTLRILAALRGVDCVLVGMHRPQHVVDSVGPFLRGGPLPSASAALGAVRAAHGAVSQWFCTAASGER